MAGVKNFLRNKKAENYVDLVFRMLQALCDLGCNMSLKLHFINNHLEQFPDNLRDVSEKQGVQLHQDFKTMENHYQGC